ncbi:MAG: hypothetical protein DRQ89_14615 [Epsilonproteobacteria bacterium]|nr:MAG: hypothetical protein DRQ89_14615 [Campylobacterota bacterium]
MTVADKIPRIEYPATSGVTVFPYDWDMLEESDIEATLDDVSVFGFTYDDTDVTFAVAPVGDLVIYRRTPVHQPEDYAFSRGFKANKTELTIDRCYMIAQEKDSGLTIGADISAERTIADVTVESNRGTDATVPLWDTDEAGMFAGEVTETAPDDGTDTDKPESYVWLQYGGTPPPPAFAPVSGEGYAVSEETGTPAFAHPYQGETWNEITISSIHQANTDNPHQSCDMFNINAGAPDLSRQFIDRTGVGEYYIFQALTSDFDTDSKTVWQAAHEITLDYTGWLWNHWYWVGMSYSYTLNKIEYWIRNLTLQEEGSKVVAIQNLEPIHWGMIPPAACYWGLSDHAGITPINTWKGVMSQVMIHDKFIDLSVLANRDKFCCVDGIKYIGDNGEFPFGEIPDVYMPRGLPLGNLGTRNIGAEADFIIYSVDGIDTVLPPIGCAIYNVVDGADNIVDGLDNIVSA